MKNKITLKLVVLIGTMYTCKRVLSCFSSCFTSTHILYKVLIKLLTIILNMSLEMLVNYSDI
jgi:hypothetical protein